jgi:hypothetical protein
MVRLRTPAEMAPSTTNVLASHSGKEYRRAGVAPERDFA